MPKKLMFRIKSEVGDARQWRYAISMRHDVGPAGLPWLTIEMDNGDTLFCHPSQIDCIIQRDTHPSQ